MLLLKIKSDLSVNVDNSIRLKEDQMKNFKKCLLGGFYDAIIGKMKTVVDSKKSTKAGKKIMLDP